MSFFGGFPFGGGFPGEMPQMPSSRQQKSPPDTNKLYNLLGVDKKATTQEIKKAYRKLVATAHPDKGGDPEKFKEITKAHEILSDPEKREIYDRGGEEALEAGGGDGRGDPTDILSAFFGGGGGGGGGRRQKRGEDVVFPLKVSLEELYNGGTKKLRLTRNAMCKDCDGRGGKAEGVRTCQVCKGRGVRVIIRQLGPGMIQQMQSHCDVCSGSGQVIDDQYRCQICQGQRTVKEKKTLEVVVQKGMSHGQKVTFSGEGDEAPDTIPGDVVVVVQQKEHDYFKRDGPNLLYKKTITVLEALTGFEFIIKHMDEDPPRYLRIRSDPNMVYRTGDIKCISGEGMPTHKNPMLRGNLYVEMNVEFPKPADLSEQQKALLKRILPSPAPLPPSHPEAMFSSLIPPPAPGSVSIDDVTLIDVDIQAEKRKYAEQAGDAHERNEDDDERHGPAVGCRAQ